MRIDSSGRVGIGTSTPTANLTVFTTSTFDPNSAVLSAGINIQQSGGTAGAGNYSTGLSFSKINSSRPYGAIVGVQTTADDDQGGLAFLTHSGSTATDVLVEGMRIDSAGNVLVGTTTPIASATNRGNITINGSVSSILSFGIGGAAKAYLFHDDASFDVWNVDSSPMVFATADTERMRIDSSGNLMIGGTTAAAVSIFSTKPITGAVTGYGFVNQGVVQSDVTGTTRYFHTLAATQAASFTSANIRHYEATQSTFGAGSAVTNQFGYWADSTLIGATNNFGFYSNIASGTGRWNFYANGTAENYLNGKVRLTSTASISNLDAQSTLVAASTGTSGHNISLVRYNTDTVGPTVYLAKSKTTSVGANTIVASGDNLGVVNYLGNDGTNFIPAATISAAVDGTPGTNDMPGRLIFSTTADGASVPTERMRITSAGNVGIGTAAPAVEFEVSSATGSATPVPTEIRIATTNDASDWSTTLPWGRLSFYSGDGSDGGGKIQGSVDFVADLANGGRGSMVFNTSAPTTGTLTRRMSINSSGTVVLSSGSGLLVSATAVTSPAATDGNVFSGTYTPTLTNTANVSSSTAITLHYVQVGRFVTVSGAVSITATATGTNTVLTMSLPVASNFTSNTQIGGSGASVTSGNYGGHSTAITANATTDTAELRLNPTLTTAQQISFCFSYRII
jgi:hypothetical protein